MRIIAGAARGCVLFSPKNDARPTLDMVKESLFNIIAPTPGGAAFLDLFAGSGAIGLEALSRGAAKAVFVDTHVSAVRKNIEKTKMNDKARVLKMDCAAAIRFLALKNERFDFIYADPPYGLSLAQKTAEQLAKHRLVNEGGLIMIEYGKNEPEIIIPSGMNLVRKKNYSGCIIDFLSVSSVPL